MNRKGFSKMLVPIDGSEGSIKAASLVMDIAKKYGVQVTVLQAVNIDQHIQALVLYCISYPDPARRMVEKTKQKAARWFAEVQKEAETSGVRGVATSTILRHNPSVLGVH
jgi:nucleotide-binding universal stress UspA family protein